MKSGIYSIINITNGKQYIGSSKNMRYRWTEHKRQLRKNIHQNHYLQNSYNSYGKDSFELKILDYISSENLIVKEQFYLDKFQSYNREFGYNICEKAYSKKGVRPWNKDKSWSEEVIEKISKSHRGKTLSKEHRNNISKASKGKPHSDEHNRNKRRSKSQLKGKFLICLICNTEFYRPPSLMAKNFNVCSKICHNIYMRLYSHTLNSLGNNQYTKNRINKKYP